MSEEKYCHKWSVPIYGGAIFNCPKDNLLKCRDMPTRNVGTLGRSVRHRAAACIRRKPWVAKSYVPIGTSLHFGLYTAKALPGGSAFYEMTGEMSYFTRTLVTLLP